MSDQNSDRRGFIKGTAAGLAGAFLALRGAPPAEAAAMSFPLQEIRMPLPLIEVNPTLSPDDLWRWRYLSDLNANSPDGLEEAYQIEYLALEFELQRLAALGSVNSMKVIVVAYEKAKLQRGSFAAISFAFKQSGETIRLTHIVSRTSTGETPELAQAKSRYETALHLYKSMYELTGEI